jgi:hypothetical protein
MTIAKKSSTTKHNQSRSSLPILLSILFVLVLVFSKVANERRKEAVDQFMELPLLALDGAMVKDVEAKLGTGKTLHIGSFELRAYTVGRWIVCGAVEDGRLTQCVQIPAEGDDERWAIGSWLGSYVDDRTLEEVQATVGQGELLGSDRNRFWLYQVDAEFYVLAGIHDNRLVEHSRGFGGRDFAIELTLSVKPDARRVKRSRGSSPSETAEPSGLSQ